MPPLPPDPTTPSTPDLWLWPLRLPAGKITLLAGDPGTGKSMLALHLAAQLSRGLPLGPAPLDPSTPSPLTPASTLLLAAEDELHDTLLPRLHAAGANLKYILPLACLNAQSDTPPSFDLAHHISTLHGVLPKIADQNPRLLILDPLSAFLNFNTLASRTLLTSLSHLAARHNLAILAINHLRKSASTTALYRSLGHISLSAAARSLLFTTHDPHHPGRILLSTAKSNLGPPAPTLAYSLAKHALIWEKTEETAPDSSHISPTPASPFDHPTDRRHAIRWLTEILSQSPLPALEVQSQATKLGFSKMTLRRAMCDLNIRTTRTNFSLGQWLWALPAKTASCESVA